MTNMTGSKLSMFSHPRENNRLLDYYKIISISRPILARANMGLDFISCQYGNAHVLICIYFTFENYIAHGTYFPCIISKWTCNHILQFGQIQPSIQLISTYRVLGSQATKKHRRFSLCHQRLDGIGHTILKYT